MSVLAQATAEAQSAGATPAILALAQKLLGQKAYIGWCQEFVQKVGGTTSGGTAYQAWQNAQNKVQGMQGIQPGDLVYFGPDASNNNDGHTGVYAGNGQFISATDSGIMNNSIPQWQNSTGQKVLGYVPQGPRQAQQPAASTQMTQPQTQRSVPRAPIQYTSQDMATATNPVMPSTAQVTPTVPTATSPLGTTNPLSATNPLQPTTQ
jgi:hypothetical protein